MEIQLMTTRFAFSTLLGVALALGAGNSTYGATLTLGDPGPDGIVYRWTVTELGAADNSGAMVRHVGALSFSDPINAGDPIGTGWTHTSDWVAFELTAPASVTIQLDRTAGVPNGTDVAGDQLYPAFALYSGWDNDDGDDHVYNSSGNFAWAEDLNYIGNEPNAGGASSVAKTFDLDAGSYSIALGGNPPGSIGSGRQGYTATITTQPVPEPSAFVLGGLSLLSLFAARGIRRRSSN